MTEHQFEYFNQKFTTRFVGSLLVLFLILLFGSIKISTIFFPKNPFSFFSCVILAFVIPYFIYRLNRKKIKKQGSAKIRKSNIEFKLDNDEKKINYSDIKSYRMQNYNGTVLNLVFRNGEKFNIGSNNTYCNTTKFDRFCIDFEQAVKDFNQSQDLQIERKKTFFEKAWLLPFLILLTTAFLLMIIHSFITGRKIPISSLFMSVGPLLTLWGGYLAARK